MLELRLLSLSYVFWGFGHYFRFKAFFGYIDLVFKGFHFISSKIKLLAWLVCFNRSLCIYISVLFSLLIHLRSGLDQSILNSFEDLGLCLMLLGLILGIFCILFLLNESLALILHGLALCSYNLMQPKTKNHHFIFANYIMNMGCIWEAQTM